MPASARLRFLTEYQTPADPANATDSSKPKYLKTTDGNMYAQQVIISNPSADIVIAPVSLPMAQNEASRSWTQVSSQGSVTGITASGTGAITATLTFPARSAVTMLLTSTYNAPSVLVDSDGKTVARASTAIIARYTEQTVNGTTVAPQVEVEVPLRPVNLGTGPFIFAFRDPDADTVLRGLVSGMSDADFVRLSGWIESGNDLWDLVRRPAPNIAATMPAEGTAGMPDEWTVAVMTEARTITGVSIIPAGTITGQATNYVTLALRNRGQAGAGNATIADLAFSSGAVVASANVEKPLTLSATPANLNVVPGDVLTMSRLVTGTGMVTPSFSTIIKSRPLS